RIAPTARASDCIACGQCEGVCPQHLPIIELLKEASQIFDKQ
ncbi:MAG: 4Fe-4S dicluster domain-containing protein, partial [Oscillospiraceae bacterium]|nr:4Fe-4S dicluster domain-containing protein [Oscillospiraceae bacterium]